MKFCIFRAEFQWRQRIARKRAVLKVYERTIDYGGFKYREYKYVDNWDEIYQNYSRRAFTLSTTAQADTQMARAKRIFEPIIRDYSEKLKMKSSLVTAYKQFIFIQMRLIRARNSKKRYYNQLRKLWATKVSNIKAKAAAKKSKDRNSVLAWTEQLLRCEREALQEVPLAKLIKKFLERYLYWCMLRYSIAFF